MKGHAFFVVRPRVIQDLRKPHFIEEERSFTVMKEIILPWIDYENFITDLLVDRQFLEDHASLCSIDVADVNCLFIKPRKRDEGILVVPDGAFVYMAAYYSSPDADR